MDEHPFKVGDKVKCIDKEEGLGLYENEIYIVVSTQGNNKDYFVVVTDQRGYPLSGHYNWCTSRFIKYEEPTMNNIEFMKIIMGKERMLDL